MTRKKLSKTKLAKIIKKRRKAAKKKRKEERKRQSGVVVNPSWIKKRKAWTPSSPSKRKKTGKDDRLHWVYLLRGRYEYLKPKGISVETKASEMTYWGYSVDPYRRLRQHKRELAGGAVKTGKGVDWEHVLIIGPFPTQHDALRFEYSQLKNKRLRTVPQCLFHLNKILHMDRATSRSKLTTNMKLKIHWTKKYYDIHTTQKFPKIEGHKPVAHEEIMAMKYKIPE